MCGRYYIDDDTAKEIEKLVRQVEEKLKKKPVNKEVYPTETAPVIGRGNNGLQMDWKQWGFPGIGNRAVIFNARSETAQEKKMFRNSLENRRIIIPAAWFYEWNRAKEKVAFSREDSTVLYMAGFFSRYGNQDRFVILTTKANGSVKETHERMPLILEQDELEDWIFDDSKTESMLHKIPLELRKKAQYEQQSFF